jgi:hypothetical protein
MESAAIVLTIISIYFRYHEYMVSEPMYCDHGRYTLTTFGLIALKPHEVEFSSWYVNWVS